MPVRFDVLFQLSPNAYMVVDRELRFIEVNRAYEQVTGHTREQLLGRCLFDIFPGTSDTDGASQASVLRESLERTLRTGERDELALIPYEIPRPGEPPRTHFWSATHTPVRDEAGEVVGVLQHTTDVTEVQRLRQEVRLAREAGGLTLEQMQEGVLSRAAAVQRANERLSSSVRFLTDLMEQAPGFVAVLHGPTHRFALANRAYEQLIGRRDFIGKDVHEVLPEVGDQGFFELLDQVFLSGEPYLGHSLPVTLDVGGGEPEVRYVDFVYQPIRNAEDRVEGVFVQGSDVTGREHAIAVARESAEALRIADQQKDRFLAMLAHELRNPLAPISNAAQLLSMAPDDPDTVRRAAAIIGRQSRHMRLLVEDLVDLSRVTRRLAEIDRKPVSLAEVIVAALEQAAPKIEQRSHALQVENHGPDLQLSADATRLTQVVTNLLHNAAKYTPGGGEIRLRIEREGDNAVVQVIDNGIGIEAGMLGQIFDLFTQAERAPERSEGGLGIGLALARNVAELHGGTLQARSAGLGRGSTFELRLPLLADAEGGEDVPE